MSFIFLANFHFTYKIRRAHFFPGRYKTSGGVAQMVEQRTHKPRVGVRVPPPLPIIVTVPRTGRRKHAKNAQRNNGKGKSTATASAIQKYLEYSPIAPISKQYL